MKYLLTLILATFALAGCKGACPILNAAADLAAEICVVVTYEGEDGQEHKVTLGRDEILREAQKAALKTGAPPPKMVPGEEVPCPAPEATK